MQPYNHTKTQRNYKETEDHHTESKQKGKEATTDDKKEPQNNGKDTECDHTYSQLRKRHT